MSRPSRRGTLGAARSIFRWDKRNPTPPKTPAEAVAALAESSLVCEPCHAKFSSRESWEQHLERYHKPVRLTKDIMRLEQGYE